MIDVWSDGVHVAAPRDLFAAAEPPPGGRLYHRPISVAQAQQWVAAVHRHLPEVQGGLWASGAFINGELVGVALVGWPAGPLMRAGALAILRVAVREGVPNACSRLYGACSRAARALGATDLVTYTRREEDGASLRAANFVRDGETRGGEYARPSRHRRPARDPRPKVRWWAAWGARAKSVAAASGGDSL